MQEGTADPDSCFFEDCPFDILSSDPDLPEIFHFAMRSVERWTIKDKLTKQDNDHYALSAERFRLACDEFLVPREQMRVAHGWVDLVATAASEAPEIVIREARAAVRKMRREVD